VNIDLRGVERLVSEERVDVFDGLALLLDVLVPDADELLAAQSQVVEDGDHGVDLLPANRRRPADGPGIGEEFLDVFEGEELRNPAWDFELADPVERGDRGDAAMHGPDVKRIQRGDLPVDGDCVKATARKGDDVVLDLIARAAKEKDRLRRRRRLALSSFALLDEPVAEVAEVSQVLRERAVRVAEEMLRVLGSRRSGFLSILPSRPRLHVIPTKPPRCETLHHDRECHNNHGRLSVHRPASKSRRS
jgi:hypothetical protein